MRSARTNSALTAQTKPKARFFKPALTQIMSRLLGTRHTAGIEELSCERWLKAQHPEFEVWNQGTHGKAGVACADCHMPYMREGAMKVSDHWVRSPLLNVNRACQQCHHYPEDEIKRRVETIQDRHYALLTRAGAALVDMIDAIKSAKAAGASNDRLAPLLELQRKAQWRLDFVAAENSMGFHAPQELARILGESIDYSRQAQPVATRLGGQAPSTVPTQTAKP